MNTVEGVVDPVKIKISFKPESTNNKIKFGGGIRSNGLRIICDGDNINIDIGSGVSINGVIRICSNCKLIIGNNRTASNPCYWYIGEGTVCKIGNDCMFSSNITFRTDDSHAIYSVTDCKRINVSRDISIGNHVLIFPDCKILKGTIIDDGSIVAANTICSNSHISNNAMVAGAPYKYCKLNVAWDKTYVNSQTFQTSTPEMVKEKNAKYWHKTVVTEDVVRKCSKSAMKDLIELLNG